MPASAPIPSALFGHISASPASVAAASTSEVLVIIQKVRLFAFT